MIILGCDTSTKTAHLFLGEYEEDQLSWYETTSVVWNNTHSEQLLDRLLLMCSDHSIELSELDLLCASSGPGSFTGLRIALATMKGLALGLNKPLVSVPTLDLFQDRPIHRRSMPCGHRCKKTALLHRAVRGWNPDRRKQRSESG
ncbi:MAG TPA: tRNA (adenosine(37)-N6)-threonylcarbamoyltransferase complex dimerization subunit type 1 TsaB [Sphaerochaeta sp.]|nr:tRNA (adenosine(37)-N6)-threonylcarbamoyltransferase complex dimerization subunit type 1 TsaB [Sphaerochaeta sp.]